MQEHVRNITEKNERIGLFSVTIWAWEDIRGELSFHSQIIEKYYEWPISNNELLNQKYKQDLEYVQSLIDDYNPRRALDFLKRLEKQTATSASSTVRYGIISKKGVARNLLGQHIEAARLFVDALKHAPNKDKAICNAAAAFHTLGEKSRSVEMLRKRVDENPGDAYAWSMFVQIQSENKKLADLIASTPKVIRNDWQVAQAFGRVGIWQQDYIEAEKWLRVAINKCENPSVDLLENMAMVIQENARTVNIPFSLAGVSQAQKVKINESIDLFTKAWSMVENSDLRSNRVEYLIKRGWAKKFIGDITGAIDDLDLALIIQPENCKIIENRAALAMQVEDYEMAISLLEKVRDFPDANDVDFFLAEAYASSGKHQMAADVLLRNISKDITPEKRTESKRLLIHIYVDLGDFEEGSKIANSLIADNPKDVSTLVVATRLYRKAGDLDKAKDLRESAYKLLPDNAPSSKQLELGEEFYSAGDYDTAAEIYQRLTNEQIDSPITNCLLDAYYAAGKWDKALKLCRELREQVGPTWRLVRIETTILEYIGDIKGARSACENYLEVFPDETEVLLFLAHLEFREGRTNVVDKLAARIKTSQKYSLHEAIGFGKLSEKRDDFRAAIEVMYEARRTYFSEAEVHRYYFWLIANPLSHSPEIDDWLRPKTVGNGTAIKVKSEEDDDERWYIIDDRVDVMLARNEIPIDHQIASDALGKVVGQSLITRKNPFGESLGTIVEIQSKYVRAFQETTLRYEGLFPEAGGLYGFKIKDGGERKDPQVVFAPLLKSLADDEKRVDKVLQFYKDEKLSVGAVANLIGKSVIKVWSRFAQQDGVHLIYSRGNVDDTRLGLAVLEMSCIFVVDPIALLTINSVDGMKAIIGSRKMVVAQSVVDLFRGEISDWKMNAKNGRVTVGKVRGTLFREEMSGAQVQENIDFFEAVIAWTQTHCEIVPCKSALKLKRHDKEKLDEMLGQAFTDSLLLGKEDGQALYSDDERLRSFAQTEHQANVIWTEPILLHALMNRSINNETICGINIQLIMRGYRFVSIRVDELMEAARQASFELASPFTNVVETLNEPSLNIEPKLNISVNFICELWQTPVLPVRRNSLIEFYFRTILAKDKKRNIFFESVKEGIRLKFKLMPFASAELIDLLNVIRKSQIGF